MTPVPAGGDAWTVDLDPAWPGFAGHFPGNPILPGAELVAWALELAAARGVAVAGVSRARFTAVARPGERLRLVLRIADGDAQVTVARGDVQVARITLAGA